MKEHNWKHFAVAGTLVVVLGFGTPAVAADPPDAWITTKVKLALLTSRDVSSVDVNVDTIDGRVTIHGTVDSAAEKARAEQAVRDVAGVREVRNLLAVVPPSRQDAVAASDEQIKKEVESALKEEPALADSDVGVSSVNKGVVLLSGTAETLSDHVRAVEIARGVPGVRQVSSKVQSPDELSDAEIWRDTKQAAADTGSAVEGAGQAVGATVTDMWITTAAKVRLMANDKTPATSINVDTHGGVVTLFGMVPTEAAKSAAETEAKKVDGVKRVDNKLQVVAESAQPAVKANDAEIKDAIAARVDESIEDADIRVEVADGVVRLTGTVERQMDRLRALTSARTTPGVRAVVDELQLASN